MCFESTVWALKQPLPAMQKMVLVILADHENKDSGLCYPSIKLLAEECGMSERSVSNQISKLAAAGLIEITRFNHTTNRYILNKPAAPVTEPDARRSEPDAPVASKPVIKPITKPKETITTTASAENLEIRALTAAEQECFDWAVMHTYWATACISIDAFLKVYTNQKGGLVSQYDAHKKARETWTVNGLNSENYYNKNTGGNYETRKQFNQPSRLSPMERIRKANGLGEYAPASGFNGNIYESHIIN